MDFSVGKKKMAPKHTNPKVANTIKMRYFSLGRKDAALLGPIMDPNIPPLEAGGISYSKNQKYILFFTLFLMFFGSFTYNTRREKKEICRVVSIE